ncbi:curli production assembly/transport component CsgF [Bacteroidota bacterium]
MKNLNWIFILIFLVVFLPIRLNAQDFIYKAKNPFFGGDSYNYTWMLSSAQVQNTYENETQDQTLDSQSDPLTDFADNLNRQVLSNLSQLLVSDQFGLEELKDGTYTLGDYQIEISSGGEGIQVIITDFVNGGQTSVLIPYF